MKYKILEINGKFVIICEVEKEVGFLWWKKKKIYTKQVNTDGCIISEYSSNMKYYIFSTLDAAKEQVEIFKSPSIIHDI